MARLGRAFPVPRVAPRVKHVIVPNVVVVYTITSVTYVPGSIKATGVTPLVTVTVS